MDKALTPVDLAFLALESQVQTGHVGGLAIFKLPKGAKGGFFQHAVETHSDWKRAEGLFRLVVRRKGIGLGWVEAERVDVASHIHYLALPKPGLAFARENVRDVDAGARFDFRITVSERSAQQPRQMFAHGRLARAHGAYQEDVGLARGHVEKSIAEKKRPPGGGRFKSAGCPATSLYRV